MGQESLDQAESLRRNAQAELDKQRNAASRNKSGQFSTPTELALEMAVLGKACLPTSRTVRFLDPAIGSGVFFYAAQRILGRRIEYALGHEIDSTVAEIARRLWQSFGLHVNPSDFCTSLSPAEEADKANFVLCNPPYVRHHYLTDEQKIKLREEIKGEGFQLSGLSGLYCYFLLLTHRWMASDGVGVWIVPAEFLDVNYGAAVKQYLTKDVTPLRIHRFSPQATQFNDALVSSVVLLFKKTRPSLHNEVYLTAGDSLSAPNFNRMVLLRELDPMAKWGPLFDRQDKKMPSKDALRIGNLFSVRRGLATGSNGFFILERARAAELGLPVQYLRPILPSPRKIPEAIISTGEDGFPAGLPELVLLDCPLPADEVRRQFPALARYLEAGEREGIDERYLPSHRRPWYSQEARPPAPVLCTYMGRTKGGRALRFILNKSAATAPNVYLLLYPKPVLKLLLKTDPAAIDRIFEALTEASSYLVENGRVYGGGLNKIEPRELESVPLPPWVQKEYPKLIEFQLIHE